MSVYLYALSTCVHCRKAKQFLDDNNVEYEFVYVDKLEGEERKKTVEEVRKHNPRASFPTILVDDIVVVGFKEKELRDNLGL